jgi:hypothetical protein
VEVRDDDLGMIDLAEHVGRNELAMPVIAEPLAKILTNLV